MEPKSPEHPQRETVHTILLNQVAFERLASGLDRVKNPNAQRILGMLNHARDISMKDPDERGIPFELSSSDVAFIDGVGENWSIQEISEFEMPRVAIREKVKKDSAPTPLDPDSQEALKRLGRMESGSFVSRLFRRGK